jgi:putative molybdopterin biosynthesis protein
MKNLLSTKEVAHLLGVNEKMVYTLVAEKGLPATKITGKWLFPQHLISQWIENHTINYPDTPVSSNTDQNLLVITGSNDPLLDRTISLFNTSYPEHVAVFGNLGSMGGLRALRRNLCHIASSHLLQENEAEYNFDFATQELDQMPAVVNFCRREQGILIQKGNPKDLNGVADLGRTGIKIVNRPLGTGTRLLIDREFQKHGINGDKIDGYHTEVHRHLDVGLEVLSGRADAGPGIRPVAALLNLDFIPLRWERYDLLIKKDLFFDKGVQLFLGMLHEKAFLEMVETLDGYSADISGKMVFPIEMKKEEA